VQNPESGASRPSDPLVERTELDELTGAAADAALVPEPLGQQVAPGDRSRVHLVVVVTRSARADESGAGNGPLTLVARYWQPRDQRWVEQSFESLEHVLHLFVDEHGWVLRQQQPLDAPDAHELIFETHREDVAQPSAAEVLEEEVGLAPNDVAELLERVDRRVEEESGG
jgi:hypothetical protein